jgi:hypothetical protein
MERSLFFSIEVSYAEGIKVLEGVLGRTPKMNSTDEHLLCPECGKKFLPNPKVKDGDKLCTICRLLGEVTAEDFERWSRC